MPARSGGTSPLLISFLHFPISLFPFLNFPFQAIISVCIPSSAPPCSTTFTKKHVVLHSDNPIMKTARAILLVLVFAACALLVYRALQPAQISGPAESAQSNAAQCDQSLWNYVYNSGRLQVLDQCISVTGTVEEIRKEADGDYHIRFRLDQQFESLLNEKNISRQDGDLVLELICQGKVRQSDAVDSCSQYAGPYIEPEVGKRYLVSGTYVHDSQHGWNELHPVTSMQPAPH